MNPSAKSLPWSDDRVTADEVSPAQVARRNESRCFSIPESYRTTVQPWLQRWMTTYGWRTLDMAEKQQHALARLIPLLLCGEQSAVVVFHAEAQRLSQAELKQSYHLFSTIENDEYQHDQGLAMLQGKLPQPENLRDIKRRARRFFTRLGRVDSVAEQFARIAHLDSAVAMIMRALETSQAVSDPQLTILFKRIKRDEAKHVLISRNHAFSLGISRQTYQQMGAETRAGLVELLSPGADDFETLGIDTQRLFAKISKETAKV